VGVSYEEEEDQPETVVDLGNGVIHAVVRGQGRPSGSPSGARVQARRGVVILWSDELIQRVTVYTDVDESRAAADRLAAERRQSSIL
jgi:ketosteroid isomerase-like protein